MPPTQGARLTQAESDRTLLVLQAGDAFLDNAIRSEPDAKRTGHLRDQASAAAILRSTLAARARNGVIHLDADGYDELLTMLFNLAVSLDVALDRERRAAAAAQMRLALMNTKSLRNNLIAAHGGGPRAFGPI